MENRYPEIVTGAFLANKKGQIAFFKSSKWESIMVPPGGHLEYGESLEAS
ncbi:ADP-ribose pyrophosphatase, partial [bacterium]|nr:ADP-ribose pyrophosphatase [bacterium]